MFLDHYAKFYNELNQQKSYRKEIEFVHEWANKPRSILDLGCGNAHYWAYYPNLIKMTGIEKSLSMIHRSDYSRNIILGDIVRINFDTFNDYECATALFNVLNYLPSLDFIQHLPIRKRGYFIFDIWNHKKITKDGFKITKRKVGDIVRTIKPTKVSDNKVNLKVSLKSADEYSQEKHKLTLWNVDQIMKACDSEYILDGIVENPDSWQQWIRLRKK